MGNRMTSHPPVINAATPSAWVDAMMLRIAYKANPLRSSQQDEKITPRIH